MFLLAVEAVSFTTKLTNSFYIYFSEKRVVFNFSLPGLNRLMIKWMLLVC